MDEAQRPPPDGDGQTVLVRLPGRDGSLFQGSAASEARRPPAHGDGSGSPAPGDGSGSGFGTGKLARLPRRDGSLFQGTAASDPSGEAHAVSRISDINVNDVVQVDMSAYCDEDTNGQL